MSTQEFILKLQQNFLSIPAIIMVLSISAVFAGNSSIQEKLVIGTLGALAPKASVGQLIRRATKKQ
jgi:hypothetical protein